ncbi:hypothetical protein HK097_009085 [Rhizophlyctis rosea]|uniref:Uncharacterized protein n=1 Tax=Rhizophlyctis rosea TaxID=64517 RepID=A0AAD5SCH4_9FUNG|nr:hypothetical protein HK097_009085 [Rhizophlyctis rosea]
MSSSRLRPTRINFELMEAVKAEIHDDKLEESVMEKVVGNQEGVIGKQVKEADQEEELMMIKSRGATLLEDPVTSTKCFHSCSKTTIL